MRTLCDVIRLLWLALRGCGEWPGVRCDGVYSCQNFRYVVDVDTHVLHHYHLLLYDEYVTPCATGMHISV